MEYLILVTKWRDVFNYGISDRNSDKSELAMLRCGTKQGDCGTIRCCEAVTPHCGEGSAPVTKLKSPETIKTEGVRCLPTDAEQPTDHPYFLRAKVSLGLDSQILKQPGNTSLSLPFAPGFYYTELPPSPSSMR
jgi:hypothetical protein